MIALPFDITPYLGLSEGQHFALASLSEGPPPTGAVKVRRVFGSKPVGRGAR